MLTGPETKAPRLRAAASAAAAGAEESEASLSTWAAADHLAPLTTLGT